MEYFRGSVDSSREEIPNPNQNLSIISIKGLANRATLTSSSRTLTFKAKRLPLKRELDLHLLMNNLSQMLGIILNTNNLKNSLFQKTCYSLRKMEMRMMVIKAKTFIRVNITQTIISPIRVQQQI